MKSRLTLHEVAERLELHYMTVYRYVRTGKLEARKEQGSWMVEIAELKRLSARSAHASSYGREAAPWADRLEARLEIGDLNGSWTVVEGALTSGSEPAEIYTQMLIPALVSILERVRHQDLSPDAAVVAETAGMRLVGRLGMRMWRRGKKKGTVVTMTPRGDISLLPVAMASDLVRNEGFDVVELGSNVTQDVVRSALERHGPVKSLYVMVSDPRAREAVPPLAALLRRAYPEVWLTVGGIGFNTAEDADEAGADLYVPTLSELSEVFTEKVRTPPAREG